MQTKEQKRAEFALAQIQAKFSGQVDSDTANFLVGMPTMVLTNGIGQSMAFLLSKKPKRQHVNTFDILKTWLSQEIPELATNAQNNNMQFLINFATIDQQMYLTAQNEALAMLNWLKRYARAFEV
ncbi:MAG TPA: type III-B CRISPR module-associated protein Cmr5 [Chitinispirillaceae bacterium]|nr:type III-B CRISPR module-associated protein Cmr5 [Chitinispirillaceae bacterium]